MFAFLATSPPDNLTLNPANKRIDQSPSDFQTAISAAGHANLETEQLISHIRSALVDTIASPQGFDCGLIAGSEVHELLAKIHDLLDNAVYKQISNIAQ